MLLYILMIVAAAVMVYALLQYKKGYMWGKQVAVIAAIIAIILAFSTLFTGYGENLSKKARDYQQIAAQKLGAYLASEYPDAKTVIVSHWNYGSILPNNQKEQFPPSAEKFKRQEKAIREGADGKLNIINIIHPELPEKAKNMVQPPENADTGEGHLSQSEHMAMLEMEMDMSMDAEDYNNALSGKLDNCDLLIMLQEPPHNIDDLQLWKMDSAPKVAIMKPENLSALENVIKKGFVTAVVTDKPDADYSLQESIPKEMDAAFDKRYLLVTPKKLEEINQKHENLFP